MDYERCVWLFDHPHAAPTSDPASLLLDALHRPQRAFRGAMVTGTNGKGSTTAYAVSALSAFGVPAGSMPSPHLQEHTERIRVAGTPVSRAAYAAALTEVFDTQRAAGLRCARTTLAAAAAAVHFRTAGVRVAVVEPGSGGRSAAAAAFGLESLVLTSVALDHVGVLGDTLAEIADEKAGAASDGGHVVLGPLPPEADAAVRATLAERRGLSVWRLGEEVRLSACGANRLDVHTPLGEHRELPCPLPGAHQHRNVALAVALLDTLVERGVIEPYDDERLRAGLAATRWPGRLELVGPVSVDGRRVSVLLDGAHNPEAVAVVAPELRGMATAYGGTPAVVFAAGQRKQARRMLDALPAQWPLVLTPVPDGRVAGPPSELYAEATRPARPAGVFAEADVATAFRRAAALATSSVPSGPGEDSGGLVVAVGSLLLVGRLRTLLGLPPG